MSPENFTETKKKIEQSALLSSDEKKEWLFLLPKMNPEQIKELDRILSIKMPASKQESGIPASPVGGENIEYEEKQKEEIKKAVPSRTVISQKTFPNYQFHITNSTFQANDPGKLKMLSIKDLRLASSVYIFLEALGARLRVVVKNKLTTPDEIAIAFEQSPLYQDYLDAGLRIMAGEEPSLLNHHEIEAIADFRTSLRKILTD